MTNPKFDIQLATNSRESRVLCNGEDISDAIHAITVVQRAGSVPIVTLEIAVTPRGASFRIQAEAMIKLQDAPTASQSPSEPVEDK